MFWWHLLPFQSPLRQCCQIHPEQCRYQASPHYPLVFFSHTDLKTQETGLYKISSGNHKLYAALQRKKTVWVAQDYLFLHTVEKLLDLTSENCWNPLMLPLGCHMWNQLYLHNNNNISKAEHVRHCTSNKEDERFTVTLWLCSWPLAILLTDSLLGTNQSQFIFTAVRDFVIYIKHVACSCRASRNTRIRTVISCLKKGTDNESESEIMKSNCDSIFAYSSKRAEIVCLICRVFMNQEIDSIERLPTHSFLPQTGVPPLHFPFAWQTRFPEPRKS